MTLHITTGMIITVILFMISAIGIPVAMSIINNKILYAKIEMMFNNLSEKVIEYHVDNSGAHKEFWTEIGKTKLAVKGISTIQSMCRTCMDKLRSSDTKINTDPDSNEDIPA